MKLEKLDGVFFTLKMDVIYDPLRRRVKYVKPSTLTLRGQWETFGIYDLDHKTLTLFRLKRTLRV